MMLTMQIPSLVSTPPYLQPQKWCLYKGIGVISTSIDVLKVRNDAASADKCPSTASQGSFHVLHVLRRT